MGSREGVDLVAGARAVFGGEEIGDAVEKEVDGGCIADELE
jgi:hypothetical protein